MSFSGCQRFAYRLRLKSPHISSATPVERRGYASINDTKPPVALYGVDGTYASALYTAAVKSSSLEATSRALLDLSNLLRKEPRLSSALSSPTIAVTEKLQITQEMQKVSGGEDKAGIVKHFLTTLAENNRLSLLNSICQKFTTLMEASRGETELVITSAQKLDPKTVQRIEAAVSKSEYSQGKKMKVVAKIEPDIRGGLVVEVGERTLDLSVSSKLSKLNKLLTDTL